MVQICIEAWALVQIFLTCLGSSSFGPSCHAKEPQGTRMNAGTPLRDSPVPRATLGCESITDPPLAQETALTQLGRYLHVCGPGEERPSRPPRVWRW